MSNKIVYNSYINRLYCTPKSQEKWIENYPFLETLDWKSIYTIPYVANKETFIQSLQYKILHRYFNCNYNLHIWKIKEASTCNYCNEIDTIEHFLFYCEKVTKFSGISAVFLSRMSNVNIEFTILEIVLGIHCINSYSYMCNFVILYGNLFIYQCKKYETDLFFLEFLYKLKKNSYVREMCSN